MDSSSDLVKINHAILFKKNQGAEKITWFQSSEKVRRGFCSICGPTLFWDPIFQDWTAIAMGAFDSPTNSKLNKHIHVSSKGDY